MELIDSINRITNTKTKLSKYQACKYLNVSRATFDNWVRDGKIPKGKKEQGFTELFWLKEDLIKVKQNKILLLLRDMQGSVLVGMGA